MKIHSQNYRQASLNDWQKAFYALYGHIDDKRSIDSIWRHAVVNASRFSSDIRKKNFGFAFEHLAHLMNWVMTTIQRCQNSKKLDRDGLFFTSKTIAEIVWEKYSGVCFFCRTSPCSCTTPGNVAKRSLNLYLLQKKEIKQKKPNSLDDWCEMFNKIYGNAHAVIPIEDLSFHMFEETGEVAHEITRITEIINGTHVNEKKNDFFNEIADVFSWICSLVNKINRVYFEPAARHFKEVQGIGNNTIQTETLSQILWNTYGSPNGLMCPLCKAAPCVCYKKLKF